MRFAAFVSVVGLALASAVDGAAAERWEVRVAGATPFSRAELEAALRVRLSPRHRVEVAQGGAGITVTVDGRTRTVMLGDERGAAAARVVALVAAALASEPDAAGAAGFVAGSGAASEFDAGPAGAAEPARGVPGRWQLDLVLDRPLGDDVAAGFGMVVGRDGAGRVHGVATLGYEMRSREIAVTAAADSLRMHSVPLHAGIALALDGRGRHTVRATALLSPFLTRGGDGHAGVLFGGGAAVRTLIHLPSSDTDIVLEAGVDVMANQVEYRWADQPALITGRVRPWIAAGVSWEDGR